MAESKRGLAAGLMALGLLAASTALAQAPEPRLACENNNGGFWRFFGWRNNSEACEIRELTIPGTGRLVVDALQNGGISVIGWDRDDVWIRAQVRAWGWRTTQEEVQEALQQVQIRTDGVVRADGPEPGRRMSWTVRYEVFVPRRTDLTLDAHNGGIVINNVEGDIEFDTTNGGVVLTGVAGDVSGNTTNGGIVVTLADSRWNGERLDVGTTNGGVVLRVPEGFSAELDARTVNGGVSVGLPVAGEIRNRQEVSTTLGDGGPLVRLRTTNGGIRIARL